MHRDRDFDLERELPANSDALIQDLELETLVEAMSLGDEFLAEIAKRALLTSLTDPAEIAYRQAVLADCLAQPVLVRRLYEIAVEAIAGKRTAYGFFFRDSPERILNGSLNVLDFFVTVLKTLRHVADEYAGDFQSEGFTRFFAMLREELGDDYFAEIDAHLKELRFRRGVLISAALGKGNRGVSYVLRRPNEQTWLQRISPANRTGYSFRIPERDESGFKALSELRERGVNLAANALAQSTDHILSLFTMLQAELAFYVCCLNLHERLSAKGEPTCVPVPAPPATDELSACGLYDPCLSLKLENRVVGNAVDGDGKRLLMITGANQGGKSTFLRSLGVAQLMMQCGMFVAGEAFRADVREGLFTHFKREEDASMQSGKLDEELSRMSEIAGAIGPHSILLCNESFASTNEREGSEIARQVVRALVESGVKVVFVTHLFDLAHSFSTERSNLALFLRAERQDDGGRTYRIVEGEPLPTSYGEDTYRRIFGNRGADAVASSER